MATGAGPEQVDEGSHELGVKDLNVVFDALVPVADKYEFFGIQIGVEMDEVEKIQMQYTDPNRCLLRILRIRLKQIPALTWNDIDRALRSRSVGEGRLANAIRKDLHSHDSSLGTALDQEPPRKASEKVERKPKSTKKVKHVVEGRTQKVRNEQERDSDEVSESETRSEKPKRTQHKVKIIKKRSEPEKEYKRDMKQESAHETSQVCKELTEQTEQKEVPEMSESESSASSSEEIVKANKSETHAEDSSEQEQNSDEEVRGKEYQKNSEQTTGDEYASESETEVKKTTKTKGSQSEYGGKEKQRQWDGEFSPEEMAIDTGHRHKISDQKRKEAKERVQKVPKEGKIKTYALCSEDEIVNSSYYGGKAGISQKTEETEQIHSKEVEHHKRKATTKMMKQKERAHVVEEQYSDEEVREKPALKHMTLKQVQTKSKAKEKSYSASTGEEEIEDVLGASKVSNMRKTEHQRLNQNTDGKEIKLEKDKAMRTKTLLQKTKTMKGMSSNEATNKGKCPKVHSSSRKETHKLVNKPRELKVSSGIATEELDSDDRSEETEHGDESSTASSEEEEVKKTASGKSEKTNPALRHVNDRRVKRTKRKETGKEKIIAPDLPGDDDESDPGCGGRKQREHDIIPKKRSRRRRRESSPTARGSSSPSTSQEEQQMQRDPIGQRRKKIKVKDHRKKMKAGKRQQEPEKLPSSSETDDSSPECDTMTNLTIEECKKLRRIFRCFFGKLCCAIDNPVETASQLQVKRLISHSMMKDLMISLESKQAKNIALVDAIGKKIKVHPDRLLVLIDVLLEIEVPQLQSAGREMLKETGQVYPERTQERLSNLNTTDSMATSSKIPDSVATSSDVGGNKGAANGVSKLAAIASVADGTSPSQEVSQSAPPSGVSLVLAKYKQYLQSCYNARVLAQADKYLPTLDAPYINLAMIRRGRYNLEQRDEFTRRTLHGGVDQILENKSPIKIEDLLAFEGTEEPYQGRAKESMVPFMDTDYLVPSEYSKVLGSRISCRSSRRGTSEDKKRVGRFILVEGPPGIGKSTFAWEACRRWDEIESLRDYHTVVLLKLRDKWVLNATSLSDLLRYPSHPDFSNSIAEELVKLQGKKLLFVLDGFDEVSHSFHENSVIKSILCRELLPECTIILTTRPSAKSTLERICQPRVDKHVEIIGFTEEARVRYITEVFSKEPELQVNFLKYMFLVPHIKSMMYIPLNCAIIAQVYYESQSSRHLAIPRTRTQLYKALTHSLLVRHMKMKESNCEYTSMLPEGLNKEYMDKFKVLAKFAFDSYHKGESRKVTFFKEDIPEGLVHFGFMNESTEMYAGKGVERTFSFLHLSLQEYLAAWHLAKSYSIEFQVAYHRLAPNEDFSYRGRNILLGKGNYYKGDNQEEGVLLSSLSQQRSSLEEPAIFLAGITGWRCQSEDDRNHWEMYLSHDTARVTDSSNVLLRSLYEAQNPTILPLYYYASDSRRRISIGSIMFGDEDSKTPYDCYAMSFCLANSSVQQCFSLSFRFIRDNDISLVETFVQGLNDHCKSTTPRVNRLEIKESSHLLVDRGLLWLMKANFLNTDECRLPTTIVNSSFANQFLRTLPKLQSLTISQYGFDTAITSWEWLAAIQSLSKLKQLHITISSECSPPPPDIIIQKDNELREVVLDVILPTNTIYDLHCPADVLVDSILKYTLKSNQITKMVLPHISRETMAGVRRILLHCPSLTTLELKRTRLGYDGILYICSALRNNTTLRHLVIHEDLQLPPSSDFSSMERIPLPSKTTCTDFLLELNDILKDNTTLEEMKIQSGLFLPLSAGGDREYCQWTGLGPLQQFNVGAVRSGMSPNLRRSFSSSDLTQPQTQLFWDRYFSMYLNIAPVVDFKKLFSKRKEKGKKLFSLPSFTAPDTEVLQSFSGLDPRLKECLDISHLHQYVARLRETYFMMLEEVAESLHY